VLRPDDRLDRLDKAVGYLTLLEFLGRAQQREIKQGDVDEADCVPRLLRAGDVGLRV
jgi:hypothetical protein